MDNLQELYQQVIIDHGTKPRNQGCIEHATHHADGHNPLCGDDLSLDLHVDNNGVITDVKFKNSGCAISTASVSLMSEFLIGKSLQQAEQHFQQFTRMVTHSDESIPKDLGKLKILQGVSQYPARVKCASLAWHTLHAALNKQQNATTE